LYYIKYISHTKVLKIKLADPDEISILCSVLIICRAGTAKSVEQLDYGLKIKEFNSILSSIWASSEIHPASYPTDTTGYFSRGTAAMV
jgi:hypothetical protein